MSADNWGICPKCKKTKEDEKEKQILEAGKQYGKVPQEKYLELVKIANEPFDREKLRTLREDYDIDITEDGIFSIDYSASCSQCKFKFEHKFEQTVKL
jgi:hypothetical protein